VYFRGPSGVGAFGGLPLKVDKTSGQAAPLGHRARDPDLQVSAFPSPAW